MTIRGITFPSVYLAYLVLSLTIVFDGSSYWRARAALDDETYASLSDYATEEVDDASLTTNSD